jgi:agmatine deiminase
MKKILIFIAFLAFLSCNNTSDERFYMPAEWEPHDAVWFGWHDRNESFYPVIATVMKELIPHVTVKVAVSSDSLLKLAKNYLITEQQLDSNRLQFYVMPGERYWIRDHGAAYLINGKGELGVADFGWSLYGFPGWLKEKYEDNQDSIQKYITYMKKETGLVDSLMAVVEGAKIMKTKVIHEGGAIEVNGKGTLILCEATVFDRNPNSSKEEIEEEFKRVLGVKKILWMKKGLANDPNKFFRRIADNYIGGGTGGHTDEFVRFANPTTILLAWVDEDERNSNILNSMNFERMSENLKILENATDQDGKPFKIIKVPIPDLISKKVIAREKIVKGEITFDVKPSLFKASEAPAEGDSLLRLAASSYMNYLVTNGVVILPTYVDKGSSKDKEEKVRKIFEENFPDRKIVFVDALPQNWEGGGIHCSTQQQPAKRKK